MLCAVSQGHQRDSATVAHSGSILDNTFYSLPSLSSFSSYFTTGVFWVHLVNKLLELKALRPDLLLEQPKLRQYQKWLLDVRMEFWN